jgi:hypothetical protein
MSKGNVHNLGLGIIRCVTNEIEKDANISGLYDVIEPIARDMLGLYFPEQEMEIHPLLDVGFRLFNRNKSVDEKTISIKEGSK